MPATALLRFELALFVRSVADAFDRTRDRLLLAVMLALAVLWLRQSLGTSDGSALPRSSEMLALAAAPVSFQWNRLVVRRLDWLAEESPLAPRAADRAARLHYGLAAQLPALMAVGFAALLLGEAADRELETIGLAVASYGVGALAARMRIVSRGPTFEAWRGGRAVRSPLTGRLTALLALLRVQALKAARPGRTLVVLLAANMLLTFAGSSLTRAEAPGFHVAASLLPSLLLLAATTRNDARLAGFLAFTGYSAGFVALAVSILPAASLAAASASALAGGTAASGPVIVTLAVLHLAAALFAIARVWLSPGKDGRKVDFQVQLEAVGLLAVGVLLPPVGLLALAVRLSMLRRGYRASMWLQP
jgi:hypothetical protein